MVSVDDLFITLLPFSNLLIVDTCKPLSLVRSSCVILRRTLPPLMGPSQTPPYPKYSSKKA